MPLLISRFLNVRLSLRLFTTVIVVFADDRFIPLPKVTVFTSRRNRMSNPQPRRYCTPTKSGSASPTRVRIVIRREVRKSSARPCVWSRVYTRSYTVCSCRRSDSYTRRHHSYTRASLSNMSISRFLDVRFLRRYFTALILAFAVGLFIRLPGGDRSPVDKASVMRRLAAVFMF